MPERNGRVEYGDLVTSVFREAVLIIITPYYVGGIPNECSE